MVQSQPSQRDSHVLHVLRCIGFVSEDRLAAAAGLGMGDVLASLEELSIRGLVTGEDGVFGGWGLTDRGRSEDNRWLAAQLDVRSAREHVRHAYVDFLTLNPGLLQVCHDWQMRRVGGAQLLNDHRDLEYDAGILDRLIRLDDSVQPIIASLSDGLARFSTYGVRLRAALERVEAGEYVYFTDDVESYHSVWFQLHEDLLTTLGLERGNEAKG